MKKCEYLYCKSNANGGVSIKDGDKRHMLVYLCYKHKIIARDFLLYQFTRKRSKLNNLNKLIEADNKDNNM
jgi:hypothetical protein